MKLFAKGGRFIQKLSQSSSFVKSILSNDDSLFCGQYDLNLSGEWILNHGLAARFYRKQKAFSNQLDFKNPWQKRIKNEYLLQFFKKKQFLNSLSLCREMLGQLGVPFVVLKGYPLAYRFYTHPEDRRFSDVDILLPSNSKKRVVKEFIKRGLRPLFDLKVNENNHKQVFVTESNQYMPIELHFGWGAYPINESKTWSSLQEAEILFFDQKIRLNTLDFETEMDYLLYHACIQHRLSSLQWIVDFIEILNKQKLNFSYVEKEKNLAKAYSFISDICCRKFSVNIEVQSKGPGQNDLVWKMIIDSSPRMKKIKILMLRKYFTSTSEVISYYTRKKVATFLKER